jgi:hypothetical protein
MKLAFFAALLAALGAGLLASHYRALALQAQNELASIQSLRHQDQENQTALEAQQTTQEEQRKKEKLELLELRGEVTQLKGQSQQLQALDQQNKKLSALNEQLRAATASAGARPASAEGQQRDARSFPKENWAFAGYDTPESSLVSAVWAMKQGDPNVYYQSLSPEEQERMNKNWEGKTLESVAEKQKGDVEKITGIQILDKQQISEREVQMSVYIQGVDRLQKVSVKRTDDGWKYSGAIQP